MLNIRCIHTQDVQIDDIGIIMSPNDIQPYSNFAQDKLSKSKDTADHISGGRLDIYDDVQGFALETMRGIYSLGGFTGKFDSDGKQVTRTTPEDSGMSGYFAGCGDDMVNGILGNGPRLKFSLDAVAGQEITKDVQFIEDTKIVKGMFECFGAPFGCSADIRIIHPISGEILAKHGEQLGIAGTGKYEMEPINLGTLPAGAILRFIVTNSDPDTDPEDDTPVAFKAHAWVELMRNNIT